MCAYPTLPETHLFFYLALLDLAGSTLLYCVTVNVLKLRTLKIIIISTVRNFRNYVSEKMLVFVILECRLYHEQKRYICM